MQQAARRGQGWALYSPRAPLQMQAPILPGQVQTCLNLPAGPQAVPKHLQTVSWANGLPCTLSTKDMPSHLYPLTSKALADQLSPHHCSRPTDPSSPALIPHPETPPLANPTDYRAGTTASSLTAFCPGYSGQARSMTRRLYHCCISVSTCHIKGT